MMFHIWTTMHAGNAVSIMCPVCSGLHTGLADTIVPFMRKHETSCAS